MKKKLLSLLTVMSLAISIGFLMSAKTLVPGGENIGMSLVGDGIIVSGTYDVKSASNYYNPSKHSDIQKGDMIYEINNKHVANLKEFLTYFEQNINSGNVTLSIKRSEKKMLRKLQLVKEGTKVKTGLFIKERLLGIGTVSFYDPETMTYGALGHEIKDMGSSTPFELKSGAIFSSDVLGIKKSIDGSVGEKLANLKEGEELGSILKNTSYGIYGKIDEIPSNNQPIEMAMHDEVELGEAEILTVTSGNKQNRYKIEITALANQSYIATKGITFRVTDKELLKISNGIVSGMSGSPIIQNNKLVGAVTHVIVSDCDAGYGIYMEYMWAALSA